MAIFHSNLQPRTHRRILPWKNVMKEMRDRRRKNTTGTRVLFLRIFPVSSWSLALATPSSPWSIAQWITNRWLHLWGKSTQSRQLLPTGDKQSSAGASPDESFWDVITRVGDWWNYPVQHQTQSGCKSAQAAAEGEQLILYALQTVFHLGAASSLRTIIKWPIEI